MTAEITYNGGRTCTVGTTKFVNGKTRVITDPRIIAHCQATATFAVRVVAKKKVLAVEAK